MSNKNVIKTVKELKELLNTLPDDARVMCLVEDNDNCCLVHAECCYEVNDDNELVIFNGDDLF